MAPRSRVGTGVPVSEKGLKGHRLRTHGGVSETKAPIIISEPLNVEYFAKAAGRTLRSHNIFVPVHDDARDNGCRVPRRGPRGPATRAISASRSTCR